VDLAIGSALDLDLANSITVFQLPLNQFVGDQCHIAGRAIGGNGDLQNRSGIRIHFRYDRDFGTGGQFIYYLVDLVLNLLSRDNAALRKIELDTNHRHPFG